MAEVQCLLSYSCLFQGVSIEYCDVKYYYGQLTGSVSSISISSSARGSLLNFYIHTQLKASSRDMSALYCGIFLTVSITVMASKTFYAISFVILSAKKRLLLKSLNGFGRARCESSISSPEAIAAVRLASAAL